MSIHALKMGAWGKYTPIWEQYQCNPKKALSCAEARYMTYRSLKPSTDASCALKHSDLQCFWMARRTFKITLSLWAYSSQ